MRDIVEIQKDALETKKLAIEGLSREYKKLEAKEIFEKLASSDMTVKLEAYADCLNCRAKFLGSGYTYSSEEIKEIEKLITQCEHWIAQRVLVDKGWKEENVTLYHKGKT